MLKTTLGSLFAVTLISSFATPVQSRQKIPSPSDSAGDGRYMIALSGTLPPSQYSTRPNPPCGGSLTSASALREFIALAGGSIYDIAGENVISDAVVSSLGHLLNRRQVNEISKFLGQGPITSYGTCKALCGALPRDADNIEAIPFVGDSTTSGLKETLFDAPGRGIGWFMIESASYEWRPDGMAICFMAKNWSHDRSRNVKVEVYYD